MATRTRKIMIDKSSNTGGRFIYSIKDDYYPDEWWYDYINYPSISDTLYFQNVSNYTIKSAGIGWKLQEDIEQKNIISITVHMYYRGNLNGDITFRDNDFDEGNNIQNNGEVLGTGRLYRGWNTIKLDKIPKNPSTTFNFSKGQFDDGDTELAIGEIDSSRSRSNRPYVIVEYSDTPPNPPSSLYPNKSILNPRGEIIFSWNHNGIGEAFQKAFEIQYQIDNGNWITIKETTPRQNYKLKGGTITNAEGSVNWRIRTTDTNDEVSEWSYAGFELGILPQQAPITFSPVGAFIDEFDDIIFEWAFLGGSQGEVQAEFELHYSIDDGKTWKIIKEKTNEQKYKLETKIQPGNVVWKMRTTNNFSEVSPFSPVKAFMVIGTPGIPLILDITNQSRPLISWETNAQSIYEIKLYNSKGSLVYDTGIIPNAVDRKFKFPNYLGDGNYQVKLRIANEFNRFSEFAEKNFTISTIKPLKADITVFSGDYTNTITSNIKTGLMYVYRDNFFIGTMENGNFEDFTCKNEYVHEYFLRHVDNEDNFIDSEIENGKCKFYGSTLALENNLNDYMVLELSLRDISTNSETISIINESIFLDGREYPITEYSNNKNNSTSFKYQIKTKEEVDKLKRMIDDRKTFLLRKNNGDNIYGSIASLEVANNSFGYEISFSILKTKADDYVKTR